MSHAATDPAARRDWCVTPSGRPLLGTLEMPGDKSVSHRALLLAAQAEGHSRIEGFLEGEDTRATAWVMAQLGVRIHAPAEGVREVEGVGLHGLHGSTQPLDCGNAGTGMRLLAGVLAGRPFASTLVGDASLSKRPMRRVIAPLTRMGARIDSAEGGLPPLRIQSKNELQAIDFESDVASAQVKSAVLLAGLRARGTTRVREPQPTRDYTERMLAAFGWPIRFGPGWAELEGGHRLQGRQVQVPADFSSAAFWLVAASIVPGSALTLRAVGLNPRRIGLLHALRAMGADITEHDPREAGGEPVADLQVRAAPLHGIEVDRRWVADMIDEFPSLFVAAACAEGDTVVHGAEELRVKESDRLAVMAQGLAALGIEVEEFADGARIRGGRLRGGRVDSHGDHRIAMAFAVAAQRASGPVEVLDVANVATSFPGFEACAAAAGMPISAG